MWIFTEKGFLSVVRHGEEKNVLVVRSRFEGHIEKIFPGAIVQEDTGTDYQFRAELSVEKVAKVIAKMIKEMEYTNFKDSLKEGDSEYLYCCLDVYDTVASYSGGFHYRKRHPKDFGQDDGDEGLR